MPALGLISGMQAGPGPLSPRHSGVPALQHSQSRHIPFVSAQRSLFTFQRLDIPIRGADYLLAASFSFSLRQPLCRRSPPPLPPPAPLGHAYPAASFFFFFLLYTYFFIHRHFSPPLTFAVMRQLKERVHNDVVFVEQRSQRGTVLTGNERNLSGDEFTLRKEDRCVALLDGCKSL